MPQVILAGAEPDAEDFNRAPTLYTPELRATTTDPVLGTGSVQDGWFYRTGLLVVGGAIIRFGSSGATFGSGNWQITLPPLEDPEQSFQTVGAGTGTVTCAAWGNTRDNSSLGTSPGLIGQLNLDGADSVIDLFAAGGGRITATTPFTWAINDGLTINFMYIVAES